MPWFLNNTNGAPPVPGAPYNDPCIDDEGALLRRINLQSSIFNPGSSGLGD
jgi:hypothetical protein